jgi:hypothetical protein
VKPIIELRNAIVQHMGGNAGHVLKIIAEHFNLPHNEVRCDSCLGHGRVYHRGENLICNVCFGGGTLITTTWELPSE